MHSTKFSVGQQVWLLHDNKAMCGTIRKASLIVTEEPISNDVQEHYCLSHIKPKPDQVWTKHVTRENVGANLLYATRDELINAL